MEKKLIKKTAVVLMEIFSKVPIKSPYYEMLRDLQMDIHRYENRRKIAKRLRREGLTIREIMRELGYKYPGSITNILK